jgi:hypothetical protein
MHRNSMPHATNKWHFCQYWSAVAVLTVLGGGKVASPASRSGESIILRSGCDKRGVIPRIGIQEGLPATQGLDPVVGMHFWTPAFAGLTWAVRPTYQT